VCNLAAERQPIPVDGVPFDVSAASTPGFAFQPGRLDTDGESVVLARLLPRYA
jgi:maltooligosyltrehalose trehalohydrolase